MTDLLVTDSSLFATMTHEIMPTPAICILSAGAQNRSWTQRLLKMGVFPDFHTTHITRIHDIVDLAAKHRNAIHEYEPVPQGMKDEWMVGQDDELLF